jgi:hypothetical protein
MGTTITRKPQLSVGSVVADPPWVIFAVALRVLGHPRSTWQFGQRGQRGDEVAVHAVQTLKVWRTRDQ